VSHSQHSLNDEHLNLIISAFTDSFYYTKWGALAGCIVFGAIMLLETEEDRSAMRQQNGNASRAKLIAVLFGVSIASSFLIPFSLRLLIATASALQ
jgi:hypothetical protein